MRQAAVHRGRKTPVPRAQAWGGTRCWTGHTPSRDDRGWNVSSRSPGSLSGPLSLEVLVPNRHWLGHPWAFPGSHTGCTASHVCPAPGLRHPALMGGSSLEHLKEGPPRGTLPDTQVQSPEGLHPGNGKPLSPGSPPPEQGPHDPALSAGLSEPLHGGASPHPATWERRTPACAQSPLFRS